jgi:splicing factor 3B subunit 3
MKILSLDIEQCLSKITTLMLPAIPESLCFNEMGSDEKQLYLHIGLNIGVLMKTSVDNLTGMLSDNRTRYLGNTSVNLFKVKVQGNSSILAVSSKPWLAYTYMSKYNIVPLYTEPITYACGLHTESFSNGIVTVNNNTLRIFSVEKLGEIFTQKIIPLRYTPRKILIHPENNNIITLEAEQYSIEKKLKDSFKKQISEKTHDPEYIKLPEEQIGIPQFGEGRWGSCIRMLDPYEHKLLDLFECEGDGAAFSGCIMTFASAPKEHYLVLGTAQGMKLHPRTFNSAAIELLSFRDNGTKIEFIHRVKFSCNNINLLDPRRRCAHGICRISR